MRVALIDDHRVFREGLRALLERQTDIEVTGEASDARQAYQIVEDAKPDVAVLDIDLPGVSGVGATRELARRAPACRVLILSMHSSEDYVAQALAAGASGYALKEQASYEIVDAIRAVANGCSYLSPGISRAVVEDFRRLQRGETRLQSPIQLLSTREREVFELLVAGHGNQGIAEQLCISIKTVETHRAHVLKKLHVHSAVDLLRLAARHGLLRD